MVVGQTQQAEASQGLLHAGIGSDPCLGIWPGIPSVNRDAVTPEGRPAVWRRQYFKPALHYNGVLAEVRRDTGRSETPVVDRLGAS